MMNRNPNNLVSRIIRGKNPARIRPVSALLAVCLLLFWLASASGCLRAADPGDGRPSAPDEPGQSRPAETEAPPETEPETEAEPEPPAVRNCVMIGDSLTARGDFAGLFPSASVINLGINGDTIVGVTERLVQAEEAAPDLLFILCGINSLSDRTAESCLEEYETLLSRAAAMEGDPRIVIESVLPISPGWQEWKICSDGTIRSFNDGIRAMAEAYGFEFLDLYGKFERDGAMDPALTTDGLHLNESGYAVWAEELRPYFEG
ncbi:MAG: hypothetical protein J6Q17_08780 [Clostridia bacterium]|nr:hypothetical protein [Clostridia bacterium]